MFSCRITGINLVTIFILIQPINLCPFFGPGGACAKDQQAQQNGQQQQGCFQDSCASKLFYRYIHFFFLLYLIYKY